MGRRWSKFQCMVYRELLKKINVEIIKSNYKDSDFVIEFKIKEQK